MAASERKDGSGSGLSVAIVATVLVAFAGIFDPLVVPTRGLSVKWIDHVLLWLSAPLLVWLILVVSDTIRLGDKYAKLLGAAEPTKWPGHMLDEAGKRLGISLGG